MGVGEFVLAGGRGGRRRNAVRKTWCYQRALVDLAAISASLVYVLVAFFSVETREHAIPAGAELGRLIG
jgi:hypothetical protein